jgi:hypothetical protein
MGDTDEDLLPESELEDQLLVALALARKVRLVVGGQWASWDG